MFRLSRMIQAIMIISLLGGICAMSSADTIRVSFGKFETPMQALGKKELSTYLKKLFTNTVDMSGKGESFSLILGTPESNTLVKEAVDAGQVKLPVGKNSDQGYTIKTVGRSIYVIGSTDQGVLYGIYELLENYGAYFQISGERIPDKTAFTVKKLDISESPVFKYRGVLPWDNFLCGMSGYNLEDYQELVDRLTRMKFNMLQFHFYPGMAFFTETVGGKTVDPLYIGMPVDVFKTKNSVGQKAFGDIELYAPRPYVENIGNPRKQAEAVQEMMRKVIDHAHSRGWKTCVGFELMSSMAGGPTHTDKPSDDMGGANTMNPLDPHNVDINVDRYRSLVKIYPNSDYYWMWQNEAQGFLGRNVGREPGAKEFREKYSYWLNGEGAFGGNVAGDMDYAYMFLQVANRLTSAERSRLATGGWSVEHLFPGIDADFPKEITFASLNSYDPPSAVKDQVGSYRVAKTGRPSWMIEWWEFDGNEWFPQYRVTWQEQMYKKCASYGVESVTLLGWKTTGIEHNVRYLSDFSWNPRLTAKDFYTEYSSRLYGKSAAELGDDYYMVYDKYDPTSPGASPGDARYMLLGAGWSSLALPSLPGKPEDLKGDAWKRVVELAQGDICGISGQKKLYDMDQKTIAEFKSLLPTLDKQGKSWAKLMINRLEFRCLYLKAMMSLNESLLAYDKVGCAKGLIEAKAAAYKPAQASVSYAKKAVEKYAQDIRNRGDQGAIAQMNEQFYQILRRYAMNLSADGSDYITMDWTTFRIKPTISFDFSQEQSPWIYRDGKVSMSTGTVDGKPTLKLALGGDDTQFNSAVINNGTIDLAETSFMDFKIRTTSQEPCAIMFQLANDSNWYSLNLVNTQARYPNIDSIPFAALSDGKWHRVTWDLGRLVQDRVSSGETKIVNMIIGAWDKPSAPIELEFQDFTIGKRNMLD